jgi:hypothetical protein
MLAYGCHGSNKEVPPGYKRCIFLFAGKAGPERFKIADSGVHPRNIFINESSCLNLAWRSVRNKVFAEGGEFGEQL